MRRALMVLAGVVLAGSAVWMLARGGADPGASASFSAGQEASERLERVAAGPRFGMVSGWVEREGAPWTGAWVQVRAAGGSRTAQSGVDGRFEFADIPAGEVFASATAEDWASDVVGPLLVEAGGSVRNVRLVLAGDVVATEGRVVDVVSRSPIRGAVVLSPSGGVQSGPDGRFTLKGRRGQVWLDIKAPGYLSRSEWVALEVGRLELTMTPVSRLEGRLLEGGAPVSAATVWAEQVLGARRGERSPVVFTDRDGGFSLEVTHGLMRLAGATPGGARVRGPELSVAIGESRRGLFLEVGEGTWVDGVVTRDGSPLGAAVLTVVEARSDEVETTTTTGPDGRFRISSLQNGRYVVQVRWGSFVAVAGPFEQTGDGRAWTIGLAGGAVLAGSVVPASAGVRVRWRAGDWAGPAAETTTDAEGRFRFEGLPAGYVSLDADGPAGSATLRTKAGEGVVLILGRAAVAVHVTDDNGGPLSDGVLVARSLETGATRRYLLVAPEGVLRLELPLGVWEISAEVPGRGRSAAAKVDLSAAGADVYLSLRTSVAVKGQVRDAATQLPISGARVVSVSGPEASNYRVAVVTDARGEYQLPPVPVSSTIGVTHEAFRGAWQRAAPRVDFGLERAPPGQPAESFHFEGVGMVLSLAGERVLVQQVNEGGPAERAGVQAGDLIVAVEGTPAAAPLEHVVARIRGPAGTPVRIRFERAGQQYELAIRRAVVHL